MSPAVHPPSKEPNCSTAIVHRGNYWIHFPSEDQGDCNKVVKLQQAVATCGVSRCFSKARVSCLLNPLLLESEMHSSCENTTMINEDSTPVASTMMFSMGVVGNVMALAILGFHRKEQRTKASAFCVLVTGLAMTDLLGTCFVSPIVFVAYARKASVLGLVGNAHLCNFFAFSMAFFGLASMLILFAMAVERCLAISHPYFYSQHNTRGVAKRSLPAIYVSCLLLCSLPFLGFGEHKQYCPGTWCFIRMKSPHPGTTAFSLIYATLMAFLILAIFLCNGSVIVSLCQMYQSQKIRRGSVNSAHRRRKSWFDKGEDEVEHLILLALMTTIFVICSLPLTLKDTRFIDLTMSLR
ncbi:prostacyclin receptor isoform X2 [Lissotriton helveticus]